MTLPDNSNTSRGDIDLGRVWTGVAAEVWRRHPSPVERLAGRLLRSPGLARTLLTTPSLRVPWLISTAVTFIVGGLVNAVGGQPLVWLLAPGVAAIGIAYAYGPGVDPAWELAASMAVSDRMVLLVRAVCVFAVNAVLGLAVSGISYGVAGTGVGRHAAAVTAAQAAAVSFVWLLPMTAICALTLAAAVASRSASLGATVGIGTWTVAVLASLAASGDFTAAVTNSATYLPYLAIACCAAAVIGYATRTHRGAQ
jgi:hypothetical protein